MDAKALVAMVPHWHHTFEIAPGVMTPGVYQPEFVWNMLGLPERLDGKLALDIGPSDGFYTKKLVEAGARTVALDYRHKTKTGFWVTEKCLGRQVEHHHANLYDIPALGFGQFDIVLMLGVLYHVPDMLRALKIAGQCCRGQLFIESHIDLEGPQDAPYARYVPGKSYEGDFSTYWFPNMACLRAMLSDVGLAVERTETWSYRALLVCRPSGTGSYKADIAYTKMP